MLLCFAEVGKIVLVLQHNESCYLPGFLSLRKQLDGEKQVADENIKLLSVLEVPCLKLEKAAPQVSQCLCILYKNIAALHELNYSQRGGF